MYEVSRLLVGSTHLPRAAQASSESSQAVHVRQEARLIIERRHLFLTYAVCAPNLSSVASSCKAEDTNLAVIEYEWGV